VVTTYHREDPDNRADLVAALQLLVDHYAEASVGGPEIARAKMTVASTVTCYAMGQLVRRLIAEGYVNPARADELGERGQNLEVGRGFLTNAELHPSYKPPTETPSKKRKKPADDDDDAIAAALFR
jgi:hypothetical protein